MSTKTIDDFSGADVFDLRDVIARYEELEALGATASRAGEDDEQDGDAEILQLQTLLDDLKGNGGDEQWKGEWYPVGLIRDSYFEDHARELAEDCGMIQDDAKWPCNCIDWEEAARQLKQDYSSVDFAGTEYWYR
jgi:hypothetical protein